MKKELSAMNQKEMWTLFPIFLTEHQNDWEDWYEDEVALLQKIFPRIEQPDYQMIIRLFLLIVFSCITI